MRHTGNRAFEMIAGAALGGTLMYLADPERGNRRRARAREKLVHEIRQLGCLADKGIRDLKNRSRGLLAEARSSLRRANVEDEVLVDRVRSKIGRAVSHPSEIEIFAENGSIIHSFGQRARG